MYKSRSGSGKGIAPTLYCYRCLDSLRSLDMTKEGRSLDMTEEGRSLDMTVEGRAIDMTVEGRAIDMTVEGDEWGKPQLS